MVCQVRGDEEPKYVRLGYASAYSVGVDFREIPPAVWVSEGLTHGAAAAKLTASEALSATWEQHFTKAEAEWLRPYLTRMSRGEQVTQEELVKHFVQLHGRDPETSA